MARPIEPTPILKGKDADRLLKSVREPVYDPKKDSFLKACDETYRKLSAK